MMEQIYDTNEKLRDFDFEKLVLSKPTLISGANYFIRFKKDNTPLYIQPPTCRTRNGFVKNGRKYYTDLLFTNEDEYIIHWFEKLEDCAIIVTADCTGHGVPGAFMSMLGVTGLNSIVFQEGIFRADKILNHLHDYIYKSLQQEQGKSSDGMDVSVLVIYDSIPIAEFAGAMNSIYFIQDNELIELKADKKPIGSNHYGKDRQYSKQIIDISKPTVFYTGSDGYQDQFGGKARRKFMKKNLKKIALEQYAQPFSKKKEIFTSTIENWMKEGEENQIDDILLMGFKIDRKGIN